MKKKNIVGNVYGRLTVVEESGSDKYGRPTWLAKCSCGNEKIFQGASLRGGKTKSCGCIRKEKNNNTKHSKAGTKIYFIWQAMKKRCKNKKDISYKNYGARGIFVCERWMSFENFYADMGDRPFDGAELDRINNNDGYYKENCRWTTKSINQNNKRPRKTITFDGVSLTVKQWAKRINLNYNTLASRLFEGWPLEKALK